MASRVNIKFVLILSLVMVLAFVGVTVAFFTVVRKSGSDYIRLGEQMESEGNMKDAVKFYSRAVNKEKNNVEYLEKWRDAMLDWIPESRTEYDSEYRMYVGGILPTLASVLQTDVAAHRANLEERYKQVAFSPFNRASCDRMVKDTEDALAFFKGLPEGEWQVLRRYRGMSLVRIMSAGLELGDEQRELAREDLEAALSVDPADAESAMKLAQWHEVMATTAEKIDDHEARASHEADALKVVDDFLKRNPGNAPVMLTRLQLHADRVARGVDKNMQTATRSAAIRQAMASLKGQLDEVADAARANVASGTGEIGVLFVQRFRPMESLIDAEANGARSEALVESLVERRPDDADMLLQWGLIALGQQEYAEAIDRFQKIVDMPWKPISYEAMRLFTLRRVALMRQAHAAINLWELEKDPDRKAGYIEAAKGYRDALAQEGADASTQLQVKLIDGKILMVEGKLPEAYQIFDDYNAQTHASDPDGLWLAGNTAYKLGRTGLARQHLQRLIEIRPSQRQALMMLASIEADLKQYEVAAKLYQNVVELDPTNTAAAERLNSLKELMGLSTPDDPVRAALVNAARLAQGSADAPGDLAAAEAAMTEAIKRFGYDPRLVDFLVRIKMTRDSQDQENRAAALAVVNEGLKQHPDDKRLNDIKAALSIKDPVAEMLRRIDASDASELDKLLSKHEVYAGAGRQADADAVLAQAAKIDPDNGMVVDYLFNKALRDKDMAEAKRLAQHATELDVDHVGGLTYRARMELAEGRISDAAVTLEQAVNRGSGSAGSWRLLGMVQIENGQRADALKSFKKSLDIKPDDIKTINAYIRALVATDRWSEALAVARASEPYGRNDQTFMNRWLELESKSGNKAFALERRQRLATLKPDDMGNITALARLHLDLGHADEARKIITEARAKRDSLDLVTLDARWHADRGDIESAKGVFRDYIAAQDRETLTEAPFVAFGRFMFENGQPDVGRVALEQGREYQDPKTMQADRMLADELFKFGQYDRALEVTQRLIDAGVGDKGGKFPKRKIELLVKLGRFEDAQRVIDSLGDSLGEDQPLLLLEADVAVGLKNPTLARDLFNRAVAAAPDRALGYMKRAQWLLTQPNLAPDALADMDTAVRLSPNSWQAHQLRASVYMTLGQQENALDDLLEAAKLNPDHPELLTAALGELIARGRDGEAVDLAETVIDQQRGNIERILRCAAIFAQANLWNRAAHFCGIAWEQQKTPDVAMRYLSALLRLEPPDTARAREVLSAPGLEIENQPGLLMARAHMYALSGKAKEARKDMTASYRAVSQDPRYLGAWFIDMRRVYRDTDEALAYLEALNKANPLPLIGRFLWARVMVEDPKMHARALEMLDGMLKEKLTPSLTLDVQRTRAITLYQDERWEEAAAAMRAGLAIKPDDLELTNNLAYLLAVQMDRPEEALPYAKKLEELASNNATILDTVGWIKHLVGNEQEAGQTLERALTLATQSADKPPIMVHLARVRLATGDRAGAFELARSAKDLLESGTDQMRQQYGQDVDELMKELE